MNYKKLIPSRKLRLIILRSLFWVPDRIMLRLQYLIHTGLSLNIKNPKRFTEKLQLYKMYYRNPVLATCVDKYEVRKYIEQQGFGHLLNTLYGVYDRAEDIDFETLPDRFVIKTTDGSGGNNILICRDKSKLDISSSIAQINSWLNIKNINAGREWAYTRMPKSRIIVEKYLEDLKSPESDIIDYKFFCFSGKAILCQIITNRNTDETIDFFDTQFRHIEGLVGLNNKAHNSTVPISRPENYNEMLSIAESLSSEFPFVRVDLYNIGGQITFGELTFYPASGYGHFSIDEFDYKLGDMFDISSFH